MKVARKTVESVHVRVELQTILENLARPGRGRLGSRFSAFAGILTTFQGPRMDWSNVRWEQNLIDLPPEVTKVNERRIIPMCDVLIEALTPWQQTTGPVCPGQSSAA